MKAFHFNYERYLIWTGYSVMVGLLAGSLASLFLYSLTWVTTLRLNHPSFLLGLPFAGFVIGWLYHRYGRESERGTNLIIDEIHFPKKRVPLVMAPLIFSTTLLTHLFGGSAGREGTVVQVSASLADQFSRFLNFSNEERKILLVSGAGAGFGAAIGAPFAGIIFGMEFIRIGRIQPYALFECAIASFTAFNVTRFLQAPHSEFQHYAGFTFDHKLLLTVALASIAFAALARSFITLTHFFTNAWQRLISYPPMKTAIGGLVLLFLYRIFSLESYAGLGIETIQEAFSHSMTFDAPLIKLVLTAITLSAGFKGGEFIPLVFIGATAGSAISGMPWVSADTSTLQALVAVGFASMFAAASNTPLACTIMAIELFGWKIAPYALVGCYTTYLCSGNLSIYSAQLTAPGSQDRYRWRR